jgi:hypothetical protein
LPDWAEHYYKTLATPTNQVGFLLQLGYFRIVCRFFESLQFGKEVYLRERRIEIPAYSSMRNIIHTALSEYESDLEQTLGKHLRLADKVLLDELLSKPDTFQRYELTFLKRIPQSMGPSVIKYRVALFERFKAMVSQLNPLIRKLNLSDATIRYYAEYVLANRSANMARRGTDKYLLLIAFVIHQYMSLADTLILTLLNALSGCLSKCDNHIKEQLYRQRYQTAALVGQVTKRNKVHLDVLGIIEK